MEKKERISNMLNFDPVDFAEKMGESKNLSEDEINKLSMYTAIMTGNVKEIISKKFDDTSMRTKLSDYLRICEEIGFQKVLELEIEDHGNAYEPNKYFIMYDPRGIVLSFDSYFGDRVNGGHVYLAIEIEDFSSRKTELFNLRMSGQIFEYDETKNSQIWIGDFDCREYLRFRIETLASIGKFLNPWSKQPFMWLLHYMDNRKVGYNETQEDLYKKINHERWLMLPEEVQKCSGPL